MKIAKKLLIVDHKAQRRDILASRFRSQQQYEVEIASGGFQALSFAEKTVFYAIIITGNQYDMPARELIGMLRSLYSKKEVLVIYCDKQKHPDEILELFGLGLSEFVINDEKVFGTLLGKIEMFEPSKKIEEPRRSILIEDDN